MPESQDNLRRAAELAFNAVCNQQTEQLLWLGAQPQDAVWRIPVLNDLLAIDLSARRITTSAGCEVGPVWRILILHYLAIDSRPEKLEPEVTFADLPTARTYAEQRRERKGQIG